ncbi:DNA polymerase I [Staphylococcus phage vB_SauM-V1SA19]|nr:DNA polymerase I [Staphylococcus phage vB_SauM-V1SA19]
MKVLILYDYIREEHFSVSNDGSVKNVLLNTPNGRVLKQLLSNISGINRDRSTKDYDIDFLYPKVPTPIKNNYGKTIKYQDVKLSEVKPYYERMSQIIINNKYDIIIPLGKLGVKYLLNVSAIGKVRGVPNKVTITSEDKKHDVWVLPTYSIEYTNVNKNSERHVVADLKLLGKFVEQGEDVFKPKEVKYELVTSIERVREIFNKEVKNDNHDGVDITAWDLETNSLSPDREGSKPLVLSMSWENGQGATIPLYKSDFTWENGQQDIDEILSLLKEWVASKEDIKVLHNATYDINFLMATQGFTNFENNQDTKVGWYLAVTQEQAESLRLSDLAYEVTDVGGYDKPLEDFKEWYVLKLLRFLSDKLKEIKKENKKVAKKEYNIKSNEYDTWLKNKLDNIDIELTDEDKYYGITEEQKRYLELKLTPEVITKNMLMDSEFKEVAESSPEYMSLSNKAKDYVLGTSINLINTYKDNTKVINEVDGGDFNYDWIPLELMHPYASGDTDVCRRIYCDVIEKLKEQNRPKALDLMSISYPRLIRTLARIQSNGLHCDLEYMHKNDEFYINEMEKTHQEIREHWAIQEFEETRYNLYQLALAEHEKKPSDRDKEIHEYRAKFKDEGWKFKPSSGDHKGEVLYSILGIQLPYSKETVKDKPFSNGTKEDELSWKDYKTDTKSIKMALSLVENEDNKKLLDLLIYYASLQTKRNSFTKKLPKRVNKNTHNLHGNYNSTGTACITGDSLVITDKGIKKIEDLSNNRKEKVFSSIDVGIVNRQGNLEKASHFYYSGVRNGLKITLEDGTTLTTTLNHPLLRNNYYSNTGRVLNKTKQTTKHLLDNDWVVAEDLKIGDYIKMSYNSNLYNNSYIDLDTKDFIYSKEKSITNTKSYTLPNYVSEDFAEWYGMYTADGSFSTNNGSFSIRLTNSNLEVRNRFFNLTKDLFDITPYYISNKDRSDSIEFSSIGLGRWLEHIFNMQSKALNKEIPQQILDSPKSVQQAFLKGLSLDTATEKKKYPSLYYNTVSNKMALQIRTMLMNMGIYCRYSIGKVYKNINRKVQNECYSIQITYDALDKFYDEIGFIESIKRDRVKYKSENLKALGRRNGILLYDNVLLGKIKKIEKIKDMEFFDLHVPSSHSFVANNIVNHNTSRLSSNNPNLQNLPAHTSDVNKFDYHHPIKRSFISRFKDGVILQADYSALEMRITALYTDDKEMLEMFLTGQDIHKNTASIMYGKSMKDVTAEERQASKAVAFGLIYG